MLDLKYIPKPLTWLHGSTATALVLLAVIGLSACNQSKSKDDIPVNPDTTGGTSSEPLTEGQWLTTSFLDPTGKTVVLSSEDLSKGGPSDSLGVTYAKANAPIALFKASAKGADGSLNDVPYLAFITEELATVTIRHIKSVNGQNILSQLVIPQSCPDLFATSNAPKTGTKLYCLPLINQVVPNFLVPSDNSGSYLHEFILGFKDRNKAAGVLQSKISFRIIIPNSNIELEASDDLKALGLSDRLTIATNDLIGSPRRDFKAFHLEGTIAPGVQTSWILNFQNVKLSIEEELFFEQPVQPGATPAKPTVSRGASFFKRKTGVNSWDHFRVRVVDGYKPANAYNVASGNQTTVVEIPIEDGSLPLHLFIAPDFGSESASKSMSEYVKPFSPTFCPTEQAKFKPEEWRQSRLIPYFTACDGMLRRKIADLTDFLKTNQTATMETFFGSFAYLPRLGGTVLGGTNGVLSLRIYLSGKLKVFVRNPHDPKTTTEVGEIDLGTSYQLPTVLSEMDRLIKDGKSTPGLDTILTSIQRKGIFELPKRDDGKKPAFPFMNYDQDDLFH